MTSNYLQVIFILTVIKGLQHCEPHWLILHNLIDIIRNFIDWAGIYGTSLLGTFYRDGMVCSEYFPLITSHHTPKGIAYYALMAGEILKSSVTMRTYTNATLAFSIVNLAAIIQRSVTHFFVSPHSSL